MYVRVGVCAACACFRTEEMNSSRMKNDKNIKYCDTDKEQRGMENTRKSKNPRGDGGSRERSDENADHGATS